MHPPAMGANGPVLRNHQPSGILFDFSRPNPKSPVVCRISIWDRPGTLDKELGPFASGAVMGGSMWAMGALPERRRLRWAQSWRLATAVVGFGVLCAISSSGSGVPPLVEAPQPLRPMRSQLGGHRRQLQAQDSADPPSGSWSGELEHPASGSGSWDEEPACTEQPQGAGGMTCSEYVSYGASCNAMIRQGWDCCCTYVPEPEPEPEPEPQPEPEPEPEPEMWAVGTVTSVQGGVGKATFKRAVQLLTGASVTLRGYSQRAVVTVSLPLAPSELANASSFTEQLVLGLCRAITLHSDCATLAVGNGTGSERRRLQTSSATLQVTAPRDVSRHLYADSFGEAWVARTHESGTAIPASTFGPADISAPVVTTTVHFDAGVVAGSVSEAAAANVLHEVLGHLANGSAITAALIAEGATGVVVPDGAVQIVQAPMELMDKASWVQSALQRSRPLRELWSPAAVVADNLTVYATLPSMESWGPATYPGAAATAAAATHRCNSPDDSDMRVGEAEYRNRTYPSGLWSFASRADVTAERDRLRLAMPRYDTAGRKGTQRLCGLDAGGQCHTSKYSESLLLLLVATAIWTTVVLMLLCCFRRCRRIGGCGGEQPSNGLCLTDACQYRFLCCCKGCCCTRRRGVLARFNCDCAIFPAAEPVGEGAKHGRIGRGLFHGYSRAAVCLARSIQLPIAFVSVLVTLPVYYTAPASAVAVYEALSRMHISFDLLHADYQSALLRTINLEPWQEPEGIVDVDDGLPTYEPAFVKMWPSRDEFGDAYFARTPDKIPVGVSYHGETDIIAIREAPDRVAASTALNAGVLPTPSLIGLGGRSAGGLRMEHLPDDKALVAFTPQVDSMHAFVSWIQAVDIVRVLFVYITGVISTVVTIALLLPAVIKRCKTCDVAKLGRRGARKLPIPVVLNWICCGFHVVMAVLLADVCHEADELLAMAPPDFAVQPQLQLRVPALDALMICGTKNYHADAKALLYLGQRFDAQTSAIAEPGCTALSALCNDLAPALEGCDASAVGGNVRSGELAPELSSLCTTENLHAAADSVRFVERLNWRCPQHESDGSSAGDGDGGGFADCLPPSETYYTIKGCAQNCTRSKLRDAARVVDSVITSVMLKDAETVYTRNTMVGPLRHCYFWYPMLQATYFPLCVDAALNSSLIAVNCMVVGLILALITPCAAITTKRFDERKARPTIQAQQTNPPLPHTLFGAQHPDQRLPWSGLHNLPNKAALAHPSRLMVGLDIFEVRKAMTAPPPRPGTAAAAAQVETLSKLPAPGKKGGLTVREVTADVTAEHTGKFKKRCCRRCRPRGFCPRGRRRRPTVRRAPEERGGLPYPWRTAWELSFDPKKSMERALYPEGPLQLHVNGTAHHGRRELYDAEGFLTHTRAHREAVEHMRAGEWQAAATIFENSVHGRQNDRQNCTEPHTEPSRCHNAAGVCWSRAGSDQRAMRNFDDAIAWNPKDVRGWYNRAAQHFAQDRLEEALCDVEEAWEVDPSSSLVHELGREIADVIRSQNATAAAAHQARIDEVAHKAAAKIQARYRGRLVLRSIAPHGGDGYWVHLGNNDVPVFPPKSDLVDRFASEEVATELQQLEPKSTGTDGVGSGGGEGERPQVLMITQEARPDSRDSMRSAGNYSNASQDYEMRVITDAERAAARYETLRAMCSNCNCVSRSPRCLICLPCIYCCVLGGLPRVCWSISTSSSSYRWS